MQAKMIRCPCECHIAVVPGGKYHCFSSPCCIRAGQQMHLHRCFANYLGGYEERCAGMFECMDRCVEGQEPGKHGFCDRHEKLAQELTAIMEGKQ